MRYRTRDGHFERLAPHLELVSLKLGVRHGRVTEATGKLRGTGIIRNSRGHIKVLSRRGLELYVCNYYAVVKTEPDRLLSDIPSGRAFSSLLSLHA